MLPSNACSLQAHTEANRRYTVARKLLQEAKIVDGQDPWTWLAVAKSCLEQNPVDRAKLLSAEMPVTGHVPNGRINYLPHIPPV
jgi:hypothetical protein